MHRIARQLGASVLTCRTRDLLRWRAGGEEEAYRQLKLYARYGRDLLVHEPLRRKVLDAGTTRPDRVSTPDPARLPRVAETPGEVEAEVEADLQATEVYLLDAVFAAAGFGAFREQELDRLRMSFLDDRSAWAGVAENEYLRGNPRLLGRLPRDLQGHDCDTEVSDRLRQLRIALEACAATRPA